VRRAARLAVFLFHFIFSACFLRFSYLQIFVMPAAEWPLLRVQHSAYRNPSIPAAPACSPCKQIVPSRATAPALVLELSRCMRQVGG